MNLDLLHILLAMLGLSFLVFIHELGHYIVARHVGMRVEVFSIGFGKPMYTWMYQGVKWQVCYLLFGGYVKIAGMDKESGVDPHQIKDGFYGKHPWDRIKVALAGPVVNIVFAFMIFTLIWFMGGRVKHFDEFTNVIGWVDPSSEFVQKGIKPGDTITQCGGKKFTGFKDLVYAGVLNKEQIDVQGDKIDYFTGQKIPYEYLVQAYAMPGYPKGMKTLGVAPANYVIFRGFDKTVGKYSPAFGSGIEPGDRIVWANGEVVFSTFELSKIVNRNDVYLTIERKGEILHLRVPRVLLDDLQISSLQRDEFLDWKRALGMTGSNEKLSFIPYEIDVLGTVKSKFSYIDSDLMDENRLGEYIVPGLDEPLEISDRILAVNGRSVTNGLEVFSELRNNQVLLVVNRSKAVDLVSPEEANKAFQESVNWKNLQELTESIGTRQGMQAKGNLVLLSPITPKSVDAFNALQQGKKGGYELQFVRSLQQEKQASQYLFLGAAIGDREVVYNPSPGQIFKDVLMETGRTISALVTGTLSPKWLSGPVGIVKVMHYGLGIGVKEALYWMGLISLNLGLMNLLPLPVLDGGHICFSLWEWITKRRISSKVLERIILPFVVLLIAFFVYVTYQDISRVLN